MNYNFDEEVIRRGTGCVKWDEAESNDIIPLWVADMDFKAAPAIQEAIRKRAEHGVFGYTHVDDSYYDAVISWFQRRHDWTIHRDEILFQQKNAAGNGETGPDQNTPHQAAALQP